MNRKIKLYIIFVVFCAAVSGMGCNVTKHIKDGDHLLRANNIEFESDKYVNNKGELSDNLYGATVQKPNTDFLLPWITPRLWWYNFQYDKHKDDSTNFQLESKTAEKPVLYDSTTIPQSKEYMEAYLFQQGYFYATIDDTTVFKKKKAFVNYNINTGINYLIRRVYFENIKDDEIKRLVRETFGETYLRGGKPYTATLMESERERISNVMRRAGFFHFANDNISFVLDTANKEHIKEKGATAFETVAGLAFNKEQTRPQLDIYMVIKDNDEGTAFNKYGINNVWVYPDFKGTEDIRDTTMIQRQVEQTVFRYHKRYIREKVIYNHTFIKPETYYDQDNYDKTIIELNRLGVFSTVSISYFEDTIRGTDNGTHWLNCVILMSPAQKYDYNIDWEVSGGTTYTLGSGITTSLRNKNLANGANLLSFTLSGGIETQYIDTLGTFFEDFFVLTKTASANVSLEFPKFLLPISKKHYSIRNTPRTEFSIGGSLLDRTNLFTQYNLSTRFAYKWRETETKDWEVTPAFINDIKINPEEAFKTTLANSQFLQNVYRETFIEGENVTWTFNNSEQAKWYDNHSFVKLSFEEAGGLVTGINAITNNKTTRYSQYVKVDADLRHYIKQRHATTVARLYTGVGIPYGNSQTLPYLKQYFVGGPFSIRGWRVRTLGPGSYVDTTVSDNTSGLYIDRTGDLKLEMNGEYRFDIFSMFSVLRFEGAVFGDAGNIWLYNKDNSGQFSGGEFKFENLYNDLAVSAGTGIRIDIAELFLFRFDVAFPVKQPGTGTIMVNGEEVQRGWVVDKIALGRRDWRTKNLVLNIAIGYPF